MKVDPEPDWSMSPDLQAQRSPRLAFGLTGLVLVCAWLSLATRIWDQTTPLDMDTAALLSEAFAPYSWPERFDIWAHTPHPFGVLLQMGYLQALEPLGLGPRTSWSILITLALGALLVITLTWAWLLGRTRSNRSFAFGSTITVLLLGLPLSPSVQYSFTTLEEDAIGLAIFAACIVAIGFFGLPNRPAGAIGYSLLFALAWSWHFQYGVILASASVIGGAIYTLFPHMITAEAPGRKKGFLLVISGLVAATIHGLLHLTGPVRFTSYTDDFPSIVSVIEGRTGLGDYTSVVFKGMANALLDVNEPSTLVLIVMGIAYAALMCLLAIVAVRRADRTGWILWIAVMSLCFPFLYEPTSLERWTAITIALFFLTPLLAIKSIKEPHQTSNDSSAISSQPTVQES